MPLKKCEIDGVSGWKWGDSGKCYVGEGAKTKALQQGKAIEASAQNRWANNVAKKRSDLLLRRDPTRTTDIRRKFLADINRRFRSFDKALTDLLIEEDAFGLTESNPTDPITARPLQFAANTRWRALRTSEQVERFRSWVQEQADDKILTKTDAAASGDSWLQQYVEESYKRGQKRSFEDTIKAGRGQTLPFYLGTKEQFLRSAFDRPVSVDRVKLIASRSYSDLSGITDAMSNRMSRELTDGLIQGLNPREIARTLKHTTGIFRRRAETIARTEITRAHADGQLQMLRDLDITHVGAMVEWATAEDEDVCPKCKELHNVVLPIDKAEGLIPRHPNCRCAWLPADIGEDESNQKRGPEAIQSIEESIDMDSPNASWPGMDLLPVKKSSTAEEEEISRASAPLTTLYGFPPTAVMRWMGKEGWTFEEAKRVLTSLGIEASDGTIRTQLGAGRKGQRGAPADLSESQINELNSLRVGGSIIEPPITPPAPDEIVEPPVTPPIDEPEGSINNWFGKGVACAIYYYAIEAGAPLSEVRKAIKQIDPSMEDAFIQGQYRFINQKDKKRAIESVEKCGFSDAQKSALRNHLEKVKGIPEEHIVVDSSYFRQGTHCGIFFMASVMKMKQEDIITAVYSLEPGIDREWITEQIDRASPSILSMRCAFSRAQMEAMKIWAQRFVTSTPPLPPVGDGSIPKDMWGYAITGVMRWMGKEGWTFEEAQKVLASAGVEFNDSTLRTQLGRGKKGAPPPAPLTAEQETTMRAARLSVRDGVTPPPAPTPAPTPELIPELIPEPIPAPQIGLGGSFDDQPIPKGILRGPLMRTEFTERIYKQLNDNPILDGVHWSRWKEGEGEKRARNAEAAGKMVADEIRKRMNIPALRITEEAKTAREEYVRLWELSDDERPSNFNELTKNLRIKVREKEKELKELYKSTLMEVLAEVRSFGEGEPIELNVTKYTRLVNNPPKVIGDGTEAKKAVERASEILPSDWIAAISEKGEVKGKMNILHVDRGYFSGNRWEIAISGRNEEDMIPTAAHELTHAYDSSVTSLNQLAIEYRKLRVEETKKKAHREITTIYHDTDEKGYKDEFDDHYVGKVYGHKSSEINTMGVEYVMTPSDSSSKWKTFVPAEALDVFEMKAEAKSADQRHINYTLGIIAGA